MNSIGGIGGINGIGGSGEQASRAATDGQGGGDFGRLLEQLGSVSGNADTALADLATGGDMDLHDAMLSVQMESIAFDLAVQIRNRLVDAYSEIFRMQV